MPTYHERLLLADGLDERSHTFIRDREFCEALAKTQPTNVARLLTYRRWSQSYMPEIQNELGALVIRHFNSDHQNDAEL